MNVLIPDVKKLAHVVKLLKKSYWRGAKKIETPLAFYTKGGVLFAEAVGVDFHRKVYEVRGAEIEEEGALEVSLSEFDRIIKKIQRRGGPLRIQDCEEQLDWATFTNDKISFRMACLENGTTREYSDAPASEDVDAISMSFTGEDLNKLESALKYVGKDPNRPHLCGLFLAEQHVTGTDGHRLRLFQFDGIDAVDCDKGVIVPSKTMEAALYAAKQDKSDSLRISVSAGAKGERTIEIAIAGSAKGDGDRRIYVQENEGTFPDFYSLIPGEINYNVRADRKALIKEVETVSVFASRKTNNIRLALDRLASEIEIYASDPHACEGRSTVDVEINPSASFAGDKILAGFNYKYLLSALKDISADKIDITIVDTLSPAFFRPYNSTGQNDLVLVMPMRL